MWVTKEAGTMFVLRILVKIVPYISRYTAAKLVEMPRQILMAGRSIF